MDNFYWESISYFALVSITVFYQQLHGITFQGASAAFGALLLLFGLAGMLVEFAYLGYYAWNISWWAAIVVFMIGVEIANFFFSIFVDCRVFKLHLGDKPFESFGSLGITFGNFKCYYSAFCQTCETVFEQYHSFFLRSLNNGIKQVSFSVANG